MFGMLASSFCQNGWGVSSISLVEAVAIEEVLKLLIYPNPFEVALASSATSIR